MNNLTELVELLSRERLLLERLLYRTGNLRLNILGGHARFVAWASDDLSAAAEAMAEAELRREALYAALAQAHGLPQEFSFDALIELAEQPLRSMLVSTRSEMAALAAELRHSLATTREHASAGHASASEVLARLRGVDPTAASLDPASGARSHVDVRL